MNKNLLTKIENLKGAKFIGINNYFASSGEIANHIVNVNISVLNAKETDLSRLQNVSPADLLDVANASKIALDIVKTAYSEMLASAIKNLSSDPADRSNQSNGQTNAYVNITPALKFHIETEKLHIFGQSISKKVIEKGEYKTVNSSDKTLAKNAITKYLDLRAGKFRNFIIENIDNVSISGENFDC